MRVKDQVAIVTGGSRGIGEGIARKLGENGAKLVIADINEEVGKQTAEKFRASGLDAIFVKTDVRSEEHVKEMVLTAVRHFGGIDLLVNNAGIPNRTPVVETSLEEWERVIGTNLTGAFLCCKYAIPEIAKRGKGSIVNIGSWFGVRAMTRTAAYAAAKGGLIALTRQMALDCGPLNIRVNSVCPSSVDTEMQRTLYEQFEDPDDAYRQSLAFQPLGRIGTVEDIANACLFLLSDEASYISGHNLMVDGAASQKIARPLIFD
jgi:hypothetical protein